MRMMLGERVTSAVEMIYTLWCMSGSRKRNSSTGMTAMPPAAEALTQSLSSSKSTSRTITSSGPCSTLSIPQLLPAMPPLFMTSITSSSSSSSATPPSREGSSSATCGVAACRAPCTSRSLNFWGAGAPPLWREARGDAGVGSLGNASPPPSMPTSGPDSTARPSMATSTVILGAWEISSPGTRLRSVAILAAKTGCGMSATPRSAPDSCRRWRTGSRCTWTERGKGGGPSLLW
mmetsp:Transcript_40838/g.123050  ORF Transcript_40838/g.123050 Transcript_40838/m.123050 type:complete len:234 (-) Transcript_40838:644-1345(-)